MGGAAAGGVVVGRPPEARVQNGGRSDCWCCRFAGLSQLRGVWLW